MATKRCVQLTSNDTYFVDLWFSGVKAADEAMAEGVDYCGPVKMSHKGFYGYVGKVHEVLARRFISCYEEYYKSSWW